MDCVVVIFFCHIYICKIKEKQNHVDIHEKGSKGIRTEIYHEDKK